MTWKLLIIDHSVNLYLLIKTNQYYKILIPLKNYSIFSSNCTNCEFTYKKIIIDCVSFERINFNWNQNN